MLFLLSIGIGVGKLVGKVPFDGHEVDYKMFVAPGLLAAAAMNGSLLDTTFNFFVKFKYSHTYDAILATPLGTGDVATGEVVWALMRGAIYSTAFLVTMLLFGLVAVVVGGARRAGRRAHRLRVRGRRARGHHVHAVVGRLRLRDARARSRCSSSRRRSSRSASTRPGLQAIIRLTPLYQGVVLERSLVLGAVHPILLVHVVYLGVMGALGLRVAERRIGRLLQP